MEYCVLHIASVDTDGTAADFGAVKYHVVCFGIYFAGVGSKQRNIFFARRGERMVHCNIAFFFFAVFKHREVNNPGEGQFVFVDKAAAFCHFDTQCAESGCNNGRLVGNKEQQVARFCFSGFKNVCKVFFAEEFGNRGFYAAVRLNLHPGKAFGAVNGNKINQAVQFAARNTGIALNVNGFNNAAFINNIVKYFKFAAFNGFGHVDKLHAETQVRLVAAVFVHSFVPGHALEFFRQFNAKRAFEYVAD